MLTDTVYGRILICVFMTVCAAEDLAESRISGRLLKLMLASEVSGYIFMAASGMKIEYLSMAAGAAVGAFLLLTGKLSGGAVGYGDGLVFLLTGLAAGGKANSMLLLMSMFFAACFGIGLSVLSKKNIKDRSFPFLPMTLPPCAILALVRWRP